MGFLPRTVRTAIYAHLRNVRKIAKECNFDGRKLRKYGFKKIVVYTGRSIYVSERFGAVIKFPYLSRFQIPSSHCVPTLFCPNPRYRPNALRVGKLSVIQPLVSTKNKKKAMKWLEAVGAHTEINDYHSDQVGWYGDCPVIFDW